ncbi:hypothetical protein GCM10011375_19640 [Hymenobacter qilianensis]|nr:hypothetical protein GCM10011375_19640 [Hymenobacter qilianensis]
MDNFIIKTSSRKIKERFTRAKEIADSVARIVIAPEKLGNFYCTYHFEYYDEQRYSNDSIIRPPLNYHISYVLLYEGDSIGSSVITVDSTFKVTYCRLDEMIGQKYFLNDKLEITKTKALSISSAKGIDVNSTHAPAVAEFRSNAGDSYNRNTQTLRNLKTLIYLLDIEKRRFYWDIENHCDGCTELKVDAETGEVFDKNKITFIY